MANATSIRVARFEVAKIHGDHKATFARWFELRTQCQRTYNIAMRTWEQWHTANESAKKIAAYLDAIKKWEATKKGNKPKWPVQCWPAALAKEVYATVAKEVDGLNLRPVVGENALRADKAETEVERPRAENTALKARIARLEGRIEELERRRL